MLNDPLFLFRASDTSITTTDAEPAAVTSESDANRRVRTVVLNGLPCKLIIQRTSTKENKPYGTDRISIRLEATKVDPETGNSVLGFVNQVIGLPKGVMTVAEVDVLKQYLATFLLVGTGSSDADVSGTTADGYTLFTRLCAGEA